MADAEENQASAQDAEENKTEEQGAESANMETEEATQGDEATKPDAEVEEAAEEQTEGNATEQETAGDPPQEQTEANATEQDAAADPQEQTEGNTAEQATAGGQEIEPAERTEEQDAEGDKQEDVEGSVKEDNETSEKEGIEEKSKEETEIDGKEDPENIAKDETETDMKESAEENSREETENDEKEKMEETAREGTEINEDNVPATEQPEKTNEGDGAEEQKVNREKHDLEQELLDDTDSEFQPSERATKYRESDVLIVVTPAPDFVEREDNIVEIGEASPETEQDNSEQAKEVTQSPPSREITNESQADKPQETVVDSRGATPKKQSPIEAPPSIAEDEEAIPPAPHLPSMERSHTTIEGQMSTSALNIVWSFGLNRNVPVLNLSDGVREAIMYPCAHVGIMYDYKNNKQHTLQAHLNPITCSAVSQDKRWLVTGDVGPDAMVNIWDTYTGIPIQTMFDPNSAGGVLAVALTPDSRYLATLSSLPVQTLAIWDWTVDGDVPICSADLKPEYGVQNFIHFHPTEIHHVVTNSATQVLFFHWADNAMNYFAPPLSDSDFNKPVGRYSQSIFQMGIARALTATSIGNLVVWDNNKPLSKVMDVNQSADKKPLKIIKVHDKGISVLTTTEDYIVMGDTAGHVKFFDQGLRLIYWYQDFNAGPCAAISFAYMPNFEPIQTDSSRYPSDATKQAKPFVVRNFIVGTSIAVYGNVTTDGSKFKVIHREHDAAVHALAAHPKLPVIAIGSYSGLLKLWNYKLKETVASRIFEKVHIQTIAFDKNGYYIVIGCTNGIVFVVDSVALLDQLYDSYRYARDSITHIAFSENSMYFATADAGNTVTVYKRQRKEGRNPYVWHGRYRSHYKPIRDLLFDVYLDTNEPKLLSLGEDRMLIEYELNNPGKNHVIPKSEDRIEQFAMPQCMCMYPPITKEHFLFTANDEYKLKCYNSTTKMCRKTVLGPTYGSPITKMMVVPTTGDETSNRLLAYITSDKVGLHLLPASGNPHLAMALIAHPSGISNLASSFDGKYLFTAGGPDYAVHMWEINVPALDAQAKLGGEDLIPFYGLLEGGRDGEMFAELEDLFYYAQLRHQGINSMETRKIGNRVTISEVPFIMRAMGFYPSEQEIEDMLNEIKYDDFVNSGQYQEDIDLGQFIKLYINHRPAFGLAPEKLLWAFQTLAESPDLGKGGVIERGDLLDILQKNGEHMTEIELAEHLSTLLGFNREGGSCEQEAFDPDEAGNLIAEHLPYDINAEILVNDILGFSLTLDPPAADDSKDVVKSGAGMFQ